MNLAIEMENVTKAYRLHYSPSLREMVIRKSRKFLGLGGQEKQEALLALDNVTFSVQRGESVGIIGPNGAGKTTLLKLLSGVSVPTEGEVRTHGRVSSLLELGAGFHPELSGRENIYLKAAILGLSIHETEQIFDRIVNFSGLEKFLDMPVKRYSSGMYVRLAFSVVAHVEHEILLVDEVLAVGDAPFRRKCARRISELLSKGTTLVLVSHSLHLVRSVCPTSIFLADGQVRFQGDTSTCLAAYQAWQRDRSRVRESVQPEPLQSELARLTGVAVLSRVSEETSTFCYGDPITVEVGVSVEEAISQARLLLRFVRSDGVVAAVIRTDDYGYSLNLVGGDSTVELEVPRIQLATGEFFLEVWLFATFDGLPIASLASEVFIVHGIHPVSNPESGLFVPEVESVRVHRRKQAELGTACPPS